jgi:undecaprenyl-diphosphatase
VARGAATAMRGIRGWIRSREPRVLVAFALTTAALWCFAELADEVLEADTAGLDERILLALRTGRDPTDPIGPLWLEQMARDVTALGGVAVLSLVVLGAAGFLALQRRRHTAVYLLLAVGGGALASWALKLAFDRPRPDLVRHALPVYTSSFPSGHSMMSAVTFLTVGALVASVQPSLVLRAYLLGSAALVTLLVGLSRVYLGVHWPTDVVAGWTAGAAWALVCWALAEQLRARGRFE